MNASEAPNPFQVLGLPVTATDEEIARQYNRMCRARPDRQSEFRRAWDELRSNPAARRAHALLEMPDTDYRERENDWRSFERRNRKNPVDFAALAADSPAAGPAGTGTTGTGTTGTGTTAFVTAALDSLLRPPDADIAALAVHAGAFREAEAPPIGIADVISG